eukprot:110880_1
MVFFFGPVKYDDMDVIIYMGRDKHENEDLIKYAWPEDVWFHVDNLSSAHVYMRLPENFFDEKKIDEIPEKAIVECCHLVKKNSISGCKQNNVDVVFTHASNLHKTADMDIGSIGFHDNKKVITRRHIPKNKPVVKMLEATMEERPSATIATERAKRDRRTIAREKAKKRAVMKEKQRLVEEERKAKEANSYQGFFNEEEMMSNKDFENMSADAYEENFM